MSDPVVTVGVFETQAIAVIASNALEAEGIQTFIEDIETATAQWTLYMAIGGIKVRVRQEDAERATAILREMFPKSQKKAPAEPIEKVVHRAWMAAACGLMVLPLQIYSIWLVVRIIKRPDYREMAPEMHRKMRQTLYIDLWLIFTVSLVIVCLTLPA